MSRKKRPSPGKRRTLGHRQRLNAGESRTDALTARQLGKDSN